MKNVRQVVFEQDGNTSWKLSEIVDEFQGYLEDYPNEKLFLELTADEWDGKLEVYFLREANEQEIRSRELRNKRIETEERETYERLKAKFDVRT